MPNEDGEAQFGEVDNLRDEWEAFKVKIDKRLAEGAEIHSMYHFVGFDDGKDDDPKDQGASICIAGCPTCLVPNVVFYLKDFTRKMDEHDAKKGYH